MDINKKNDLKMLFSMQAVRDILVRHNLTTDAEFRELIKEKIDASPLSDEEKEIMKNH